MTFITAEPFLGHFGLGGVGNSEQMVKRFFDRLGIEGLPNTVIKEARDGEIELDERPRRCPFAYSMIVPPFTGVDAVAQHRGARPTRWGSSPSTSSSATPSTPTSSPAGVAIAIAPPEPTPVPAGVPKTGQMTETMAKVAAHNIAADIDGADRAPAADRGPRRDVHPRRRQQRRDLQGRATCWPRNGAAASPSAHVMAGPQAHWAKVAFEHVFLASRKRGVLVL